MKQRLSISVCVLALGGSVACGKVDTSGPTPAGAPSDPGGGPELPSTSFMVAKLDDGRTLDADSRLTLSVEGDTTSARLLLNAHPLLGGANAHLGFSLPLTAEQASSLAQGARVEFPDAHHLVSYEGPSGETRREIKAATLRINRNFTVNLEVYLVDPPFASESIADAPRSLTLQGDLPVSCVLVDPTTRVVREDSMVRIPECERAIQTFGLSAVLSSSKGG